MPEAEISYSKVTPIDGYGPGFFRIADQVINGAILVLPSKVVTWGGYGDTGGIVATAPELDVMLIGTGADIAHLPPEFVTALEGGGIGVEPMASPSACRLYNILLSEGRRIGCALLPV
ncbi:MAG: Mth938-like domain-containing protein [Paracoccaceae bacterium]